VNVQLVINAAAAVGGADTLTSDVETLLGRAPTSLSRFITDHAAAWLALDASARAGSYRARPCGTYGKAPPPHAARPMVNVGP
jgi:hypothetical protein